MLFLSVLVILAIVVADCPLAFELIRLCLFFIQCLFSAMEANERTAKCYNVYLW